MVLIERISYQLGGFLADMILVAVLPASSFTTYKCISKLCNFAAIHSTRGFTDDELVNNVFDCLPFVD